MASVALDVSHFIFQNLFLIYFIGKSVSFVVFEQFDGKKIGGFFLKIGKNLAVSAKTILATLWQAKASAKQKEKKVINFYKFYL